MVRIWCGECGHAFHGDCATRWQTSHPGKCPQCNGSFDLQRNKKEVVHEIRGFTLLQYAVFDDNARLLDAILDAGDGRRGYYASAVSLARSLSRIPGDHPGTYMQSRYRATAQYIENRRAATLDVKFMILLSHQRFVADVARRVFVFVGPSAVRLPTPGDNKNSTPTAASHQDPG